MWGSGARGRDMVHWLMGLEWHSESGPGDEWLHGPKI
jgi:hypothetical protein